MEVHSRRQQIKLGHFSTISKTCQEMQCQWQCKEVHRPGQLWVSLGRWRQQWETMRKNSKHKPQIKLINYLRNMELKNHQVRAIWMQWRKVLCPNSLIRCRLNHREVARKSVNEVFRMNQEWVSAWKTKIQMKHSQQIKLEGWSTQINSMPQHMTYLKIQPLETMLCPTLMT